MSELERKELNEEELEGVAGGRIVATSEGNSSRARAKSVQTKANAKGGASKKNSKNVLAKFLGSKNNTSRNTEG